MSNKQKRIERKLTTYRDIFIGLNNIDKPEYKTKPISILKVIIAILSNFSRNLNH